MTIEDDVAVRCRRRKGYKRIFKWFANLSLLVLSLLSMTYLSWVYIEDRFALAVENNVFRAADMQPDEIQAFVERHGVTTVIDFRGAADDLRTGDMFPAPTGVRFVEIQSEFVPSDEAINRFLDIMGDISSYPVLLHYANETGRSILFEAIYRMEILGWSNRDAHRIAIVGSMPGSYEADEFRDRFLLNYEPRGKRSLHTILARAQSPVTRSAR
jgi:hypothetical protein